MKIFLVLALFTLSVICATTGIKCYSCFYAYGIHGSRSECKGSPAGKYLITCPDPDTTTVSDETNQISLVNNALLRAFGKQISPKLKGDLICAKIAAADDKGRDVVFRTCAEALVDEDLEGQCERVNDTSVEVSGKKLHLKRIDSCTCTKDACNTGTSLVRLPTAVFSALPISFYHVVMAMAVLTSASWCEG